VNTELAQLVVLASHGTAWLVDPQGPPPDLEGLEATSWVFQHLHRIGFQRSGARSLLRRPRPPVGVAPWLEELHRAGVRRLLLVTPPSAAGPPIPEHQLVAFANAGSWLLVTAGAGAPEWWSATWEVGAPLAPDHRVWDVVYTGRRLPDVSVPDPTTVADAAARLERALTAVHRFSADRALEPWTELFQQALRSLGDPDERAHSSGLLPPAWPADASRLAAASEQAWVFGGMGSWNDLGFADGAEQAEYHQRSAALYDAVLGGIVAATNAGP
jgi:hypothetical protein